MRHVPLEKRNVTVLHCMTITWGLGTVAALFSAAAQAVSVDDLRFVAFNSVPAWTGLAVDWDTRPVVHIYDPKYFQGHADFLNRGLGRQVPFGTFKSRARHAQGRKYMPFFIFDARDQPIQAGGKEYRWALRLEDYQQDDTPEEMGRALARLARLIPGSVDGLDGGGLIVLDKRARLGTMDPVLVETLMQAGYATVTLPEILRQRGGATVQVLNSGTAVGHLRLVTNEKEAQALGAHDIALLDWMPARIPPVQGMITLHPQTPLSHLNLLAKNRGTFNMYTTDRSAVPGLSEAIGTLVQIDDSHGQVGLKAMAPADAEAYWEAHQPPMLEIPAAEGTSLGVVSLAAPLGEGPSLAQVGAKAANYGLLQALLGAGMVRPGYAIGFAPYRAVVAQGARGSIQDLSEEAASLDANEIRQRLTLVRALIQASEVPKATIDSIRALLDRAYAGSRIRLRSSTNCEDLPGFNGAGLYDSAGFDEEDSDKKLAKKVLEVYASLWSYEAFMEREYARIDHTAAAMALLINEAYVDEAANGVVLTLPLADSTLRILVNAQPGEHDVVSPEPGEIPESFCLEGESDAITEVQSTSNIGAVFTGGGVYGGLLEPLRAATLQVHEYFIERQRSQGDKQPYGVDIEFKIVATPAGPAIFMKQARLLRAVLPDS